MNSDVLNSFRNSSTRNWQPLQVSLELTNRCNERCRHCYIPEFKDDPKRILDLQDWLGVLDQVREAGALYLILMGGEPMLSPHFWPVCEKAAQMGFHTSMISNGLLVKDLETAKRLKHAGLHAATFSFYSLNSKTHDHLTRVKGSQKRTQRAIEFCLQAGLEVHVNCLLTKTNVEDVFELEDWCLEKDIHLKVDPIITSKLDGSMEPTEWRASREQLRSFYFRKARKWVGGTPQPFAVESSGYVCNAGKGKCAITAYGDVLPCIEIREAMGSLKESSFSDIWKSHHGLRWRQMKNQDVQSGANFSFCDHCPGMAKNEIGQPDQILSYTQLVADVKAEVYNYMRNERLELEHGLPAS